MATSDEFAPDCLVRKLVRSLHVHYPAVVPADPLVFRVSTAVTITFAQRHDGVVFLRDLAEMVIGDRSVIVTYENIRCGACRIQRKCNPGAAIVCRHLAPRDRFHRIARELLRAIECELDAKESG